jgi:hypothetical protein
MVNDPIRQKADASLAKQILSPHMAGLRAATWTEDQKWSSRARAARRQEAYPNSMSVLLDRFSLVRAYLDELVRHGLPESEGPLDGDVLFLLDGVGGLQAGVLTARRALRLEGHSCGTVLHKWQYGLPGEIWTDLMWLRRNLVQGAKLARRLLAFRRAHPNVRIHILAFSGGAGVAVFACERLRGRPLVETLIMAGPALAPDYNLAPALRAVKHAFALVSKRDTWILGAGTRLFGTIDRHRGVAAGQVGFRVPTALPQEDRAAYERLREIHWTPELIGLGHSGGHTSWAGVAFLRRHLWALLQARPELQNQPPQVR